MNKVITHVAVGVSALGLGGVAGYLIGKKRANKKADAKIEEIEKYWRYRIEEAEGPAAVITSGETIESPKHKVTTDIIASAELESAIESAPMYADQASELEDEIPEVVFPQDFPDAPAVADDFTVEGQAPSIDARAFVEQFKNRTVEDFGGVTIDGQKSEPEEYDNTPTKTVPDFILVRDPNGPYVISIDDYMDPDTDPPFTKVEMRWFKGDNVVVDARDDQVPMSTVGLLNTLRFGEGTTDPNQVYIRNERLSIDIELTLEDGLYLHEVLGQDFPDKTPVLKMRERDDG